MAHNLETLVTKLPHIKVDDIINKNTFLNVYKPFITEEKYRQVQKYIKSGDTRKIHLHLGYNLGEISDKNLLKVCKTCINNDINKYGEVFIRRSHQIPGVFMCIKHKTMLHKIDFQNWTRKYFNSEEHKSNLKLYKLKHEVNEDILLKLSESMKYIIDNHNSFNFLEDTKNKILQKMKEKGYLTSEGITRYKLLLKDMNNYFGEELLEFLYSKLNVNERSNWVKELLLKRSKYIHPIRGVLLILFLFDSIDKYINFIYHEEKHFGDGPWYCLNQFCSKYKTKVVKSYKLENRKLKNGFSAIFKCQCGFEYRLYSSNEKLTDVYKNYHVINVGEVWKQNFINAVKENKSLNELSKIFKLRIRLVYQYIDKFNLTSYIDDDKIISKIEEKKKIKIQRKNEYLSIIKDYMITNPYANRSEIVSNCDRERTWLKRNCNEELERLLPPPIAFKDRNMKWRNKYKNPQNKDEIIKLQFY